MPSAGREIILFIKIAIPLEISRIIARAKKSAGVASFPGVRFSPHITLYLCRFPQSNMPSLLRSMRKFKSHRFTVTIERAVRGLTAKQPYYFLKVKRDQNLFLLHNDIVRLANGLRRNLIRLADRERLSLGFYSASEIRTIKRYGYPLVRSQFQPHITIGPDRDGGGQFDALKRKLLKIAGKSFWVDSVDVRLQLFDVSRRKYNGVLERHKIILKKL